MWPPERIEMLSVTQELEQSVKCKVASIIVHHGVPAYHCPVQYYAYIENTFMHIEDNTFMVPATPPSIHILHARVEIRNIVKPCPRTLIPQTPRPNPVLGDWG